MEQLKSMKSTLMNAAQSQLGKLDTVNAKELGEVIDMIKDLEEAIYYCTVVKAMEESKKEGEEGSRRADRYYYTEKYVPYDPYHREWMDSERGMDRDMGRLYYTDSGNRQSTSGGSSSGSSNYMNGNSRYYTDPYPMTVHDYREGRSSLMRKNYMEAKELHKGKEKEMKELENYMKELSSDITEMVEDATAEEKQMLKQKIAALASKIN